MAWHQIENCFDEIVRILVYSDLNEASCSLPHFQGECERKISVIYYITLELLLYLHKSRHMFNKLVKDDVP